MIHFYSNLKSGEIRLDANDGETIGKRTVFIDKMKLFCKMETEFGPFLYC